MSIYAIAGDAPSAEASPCLALYGPGWMVRCSVQISRTARSPEKKLIKGRGSKKFLDEGGVAPRPDLKTSRGRNLRFESLPRKYESKIFS